MVQPYDQYEAYGIVITNNWIWRIGGAGVGVNGAANVAIVNNHLWDTGATSHTVELDYGLRTCDGQPGDPGRSVCQRYLDQGAWGTTRVDDGTNQVRIPNLNITVAGNVIANPRQQGDELLDIPAPFSGQPQTRPEPTPDRQPAVIAIVCSPFRLSVDVTTAPCPGALCPSLP